MRSFDSTRRVASGSAWRSTFIRGRATNCCAPGVSKGDRRTYPPAPNSWCRLVAGSNDSGGKTRHKRSRGGNRYLKLVFHHAAIRAIQYFPEVRAVFQQWVRQKGKAIPRALVAKELAQIVSALLTKGEPMMDALPPSR